MKVKFSANRLIIIAVVIFFFGIFYILFNLLFSVPEQIYAVLGIEDFKLLDRISSVLRNFAVIVIVEFILGVALIVYLLNQRNKNNESVIYVEKYIDNNKNKTGNEADTVSEEVIIAKIKESAEKSPNIDEKVKSYFEELCNELKICVGALYVAKTENNSRYIELKNAYAFVLPDSKNIRYEYGEGIAGQAAKSMKMLQLKDVPEGYITVLSGLGKATPKYLVAVPILDERNTLSVVELASFKEFSEKDLEITKEVCNLIAEVLRSAQNN